MNHKESEVSSHEAEFDARVEWNALELGQEAKEYGEEDEQDGHPGGWKDTLNDTGDWGGKFAQPCHPRYFGA